ncbi:FliI/YscN family ATPase [Croceicoccus sp. F390]|uniref:Flagellum-specific ATP synthase n=2 Tax=Croceicoccus esteveae TaxID=3075597 RepID=A0ABU2ZDL6_9SPHN|nr:FliI/YscN family ATPase [Croceicoccus sp. F390]MDT0574688.1 FliI/YscN family ATPase [Croceicoccus sp. F390]
MLAELESLQQVNIASGATRFGLVRACDGGMVEVSGLPIPVGTVCRIATPQSDTSQTSSSVAAETVGFRDGHSLMMLLGDSVLLQPGARVQAEGVPGMVPVGEAFLGRAVDGTGQPIDGGPAIRAQAFWPLGGKREGALDRASVVEPFDCGVRSINALATLGVGQRMGIVAGSGVGKSVLLDMIVNHAQSDIIIVALIGERAREVSDFVRRHMQQDRRARTAIIAVPADHASNLRLRGAQAAMALAEYFRSRGQQVTLIMDSLTRVAHAAREIGLLLGEPGAARGYPPSALAAITRLVERAGNARQSGGAITGLFTVLADGDNHDDPVVDTARAILDGHIVLSRDLAQRGQYPAIDVPASLSRVMSDVASPEHLAHARDFRAMVADYEANRDLVLMGAYREGVDLRIDRALAMQDPMRSFLMQDHDAACSLAGSIAALDHLLEASPAPASAR